AVVRPATEQQRGRVHRLVDLPLVALLTAVELERPSAANEVVVAARRLHDSVERHELGDNYPAHDGPPWCDPLVLRRIAPRKLIGGTAHATFDYWWKR